MVVRVAAKINLALDVLGKLPDGYHSLFMMMQSVSCYDRLSVVRTESGTIEIHAAHTLVPQGEQNIIHKAATAFFAATKLQNSGVSVELEKNIPLAAGLAGGSADAAGMLYCLNVLFDAGLSARALAQIGESVGADVPFALVGGTALCMDKGGVLAPLRPLENVHVVLCKPDMDVSTAKAYQEIDKFSRLRHTDNTAMLHAVHTGDFQRLCEKAGNVFEQVIEVPQRPYIKGVMRECGASLALMSGSGPTIYGLFKTRAQAQACAKKLQTQFQEVYLCETVPVGMQRVDA